MALNCDKMIKTCTVILTLTIFCNFLCNCQNVPEETVSSTENLRDQFLQAIENPPIGRIHLRLKSFISINPAHIIQ